MTKYDKTQFLNFNFIHFLLFLTYKNDFIWPDEIGC